MMEEERSIAGAKLRRGLSLRRGGSCTPMPSSSQQRRSAGGCNNVVSARKLGANLWEIQDFGPVEVRKGVGQRRVDERSFISGGFCDHRANDQQTEFAGSLRKHITASVSQFYKASERNDQDSLLLTPRSCSSSVEVKAYDRSVTPRSSLDLHGNGKENECSLKTSAELMKILNQIWTLEEQQESNVSLIKELRSELDHAWARVKDLIQQQLADRQVIDELLNKIAEDKSIRKMKEHEMIKVAVKTVKDELEVERKSRRHLESLHQKLVKEISEVKSIYTKSMEDLERERKIRILFEDLCDEFAEGIVCYEQQMRELRCRVGRDCDPSSHQLIFHLSEAWLDKRLQMKLSEDRGDAEKVNVILAQLRCEVKSFLELEQDIGYDNSVSDKKETREGDHVHRESHEYLPFNEIVGVPPNGEDESTSDMHCFELNVSDDSVLHCNLDTLSDQRERLDEARSSSVREKIGYFENVVSHSSCIVGKLLKERSGFNVDNGHMSSDKTHENHMRCAKESRYSSHPSSRIHEVGENDCDNKSKWNAITSMTHKNGGLNGHSGFSDVNGHSQINHAEYSCELSGDFLSPCSPVTHMHIHNALRSVKMVDQPPKLRQSLEDSTLEGK